MEEQRRLSLSPAPQDALPAFVDVLQSCIINEKESVSFVCTVIGSPTPEIKWFHNAVELQSDDNKKVMYDTDSGKCVLEIAEVRVEDTGDVLCCAANPVGEAMTSGSLVVQSMLFF